MKGTSTTTTGENEGLVCEERPVCVLLLLPLLLHCLQRLLKERKEREKDAASDRRRKRLMLVVRNERESCLQHMTGEWVEGRDLRLPHQRRPDDHPNSHPSAAPESRSHSHSSSQPDPATTLVVMDSWDLLGKHSLSVLRTC